MLHKVADFRVDDFGIENSQYFQGYGVAFTPFTDCATGIGHNPREALEDCLDQIASCYDVDVEDLAARIMAEEGKYPDSLSVSEEYLDSEDIYYYIGISWTVEE